MLLLNLTCFAFSATLSATSSHVQPTTAGDTVGDTIAAPILLTDELLKNYEAVRTDFGVFWNSHAALKDSARTAIPPVTVRFAGAGDTAHSDTVAEYNYVDLAAREPAVAAVFTAHHVAPAQYLPVTIAAWQALYVVQLSAAKGVALPADTSNVTGKNINLVKGHVADLGAVGLGWTFPQFAAQPASGATSFAAVQAQDQAETQQNNAFVAANGPIASPRDTACATIGRAHVTVDYGRPSKRGRAIFGSLVPYDSVWRTGANMATTLVTDKDLTIGTLTVPAGSYTLYTIPSASGWQLILNKENGQWGLTYHPEFDLGRTAMTVSTANAPVEKFLIDFAKGTLRMQWDTTVVAVPIR